MSDIRPLGYEAALYIALNLRSEDAREIYGVRADDNPLTLASDVTTVATASGLAWDARYRGRPAAVLGAVEAWPGRWEAFAFGTDDWPHVALGVTRFARRVLAPMLRARGARRVDATSRAGHVAAHRWLERLGARREAHLAAFGRDGADYVIYVWTQAKQTTNTIL